MYIVAGIYLDPARNSQQWNDGDRYLSPHRVSQRLHGQGYN